LTARASQGRMLAWQFDEGVWLATAGAAAE